ASDAGLGRTFERLRLRSAPKSLSGNGRGSGCFPTKSAPRPSPAPGTAARGALPCRSRCRGVRTHHRKGKTALMSIVDCSARQATGPSVNPATPSLKSLRVDVLICQCYLLRHGLRDVQSLTNAERACHIYGVTHLYRL